jgi:cobaltochelatase CobN
MHRLNTTSTSLDEIVEPVDLEQSPGDVVVLSFADSDLSALAAAWALEQHALPSVRLVHLRDLRHPMSVDLWIERMATRAKVILVRLIGGLDWWRYGVEQLSAVARTHDIKLALLPGEDRDDPRLAAASTLPPGELDTLLRFFREGGRENLRALLRRLGRHAVADLDLAHLDLAEPTPLPRLAGYLPDLGAIDIERLAASVRPGRPVVPIIFYRALLLAGDTGAIDALCEALSTRGLAPAPLAITSLKEMAAAAFVRDALARLHPAVVVTTTAFAASGDGGDPTPLDGADVPVLQAVIATTRRAAWRESSRGLGAADLAMHVVLPELDGRVLAGAIAFKDSLSPHAELAFTSLASRPEPDRIAAVADRVAALVRLRERPRAERRIAVAMPDYPGAPGRTGYAVGLDVPASVVALLGDLAAAGYGVRDAPETSGALLDALNAGSTACGHDPPLQGEGRTAEGSPGWGGGGAADDGDAAYAETLSPPPGPLARADLPPAEPRYSESSATQQSDRSRQQPISVGGGGPRRRTTDYPASLSLADYAQLLTALPAELATRIHDAWGDLADDPDARDGRFRFRVGVYGNIVVALPPDRGRPGERRADYHDPALPPRHALVAFWLWLRHVFQADALVHMGAHGTLEWLPGKAVALTATCFPEAIIGALPVFYPFIVSNPGEAAQAKRRIAAVTIGHLPPPLVAADLSGDALRLERLVDEYAQADGLDRRRRERLAALIVEATRETGLGREAGVDANADADEVLRRVDAWLCDLKDLSIKDGLHVYGRAPMAPGADPAWQMSAAAEGKALLAALDGRRVLPGPAGAPMRGRRDVLPTGRNLFVADPRMLPTPTAMEFGQRAAAEVIRCYLQAHGEMPRTLVIDLWGSATLRTGGEEIAQGLSLMGCRPTWDPATGRVTGIEVLPPAAMGRPRVDVTWRISGLFRDIFPAQIALIDAAVRAIAAREETADENPLAAACRPLPVPPPLTPTLPSPACGGGTGRGQAEEGRVGAPARIFGTAPGAYGAGVEDLIGREADRSAISAAYLASASHAYGGPEGEAAPMPDAFAERIASADGLVHPGDDPGRDLLEGAEDVAFVGGFAAAAAALGRAPDLIMLDVTDPHRPRARPLDAALARIVRARAINPRFIAGQMRHGPRGAAELAETVDRLIGFVQTTDAVPSALIDLLHEAYLADPQVRAFLLRENPAAARAIAARLGAARRHGWWHPRRNDIDADLAAVMAETAP